MSLTLQFVDPEQSQVQLRTFDKASDLVAFVRAERPLRPLLVSLGKPEDSAA